MQMFTFSVYLIGPQANKLFIIQDKDKVSLPLLPPQLHWAKFRISNLRTKRAESISWYNGNAAHPSEQPFQQQSLCCLFKSVQKI